MSFSTSIRRKLLFQGEAAAPMVRGRTPGTLAAMSAKRFFSCLTVKATFEPSSPPESPLRQESPHVIPRHPRL
jgi:hypothetical protein